MKKLIFIMAMLLSQSAYAVNDQMPPTRTITSISTYANMVIVRFTPEYENTQGCTSPNKTRLEFTFDSTKGKEMYAAVLAAAAAKYRVGFGLSGCTGSGSPIAYRVDTYF